MASLEEKLCKIRSPGLKSQHPSAVVLGAVEATLEEQNAPSTATGYFAALIALLNQSIGGGEGKKELIASIVYLVDVFAPFTPQSLLRAKFTQILSLLAPILSQPDADAAVIKPSIGCLETLLLAQDQAAWALSTAQVGPRRAVGGLLNLALDPRPKVRKKAQEALKQVLQNPPPSPFLDHPVAPMCAETALQRLAQVAQASGEKRGKDPCHDPRLMHALQMIKTIASACGGWPGKKIEALCELILGIARSGNEYLTVAVFETFNMIFEGMAIDEVSSAKLPRLLEIISELRPATNDSQLLPAWISILTRGYHVSAQIEPEDTFQRLPELFRMVSKFFESPSKNMRISASKCLVSLMATCVPRQVLLDPSIFEQKILEKIVKVAYDLLTVQYQEAWPETFTVIGAMFDFLRWRSAPFFQDITLSIGEIRETPAFAGKQEADEVLGKAIRAMGPEAVLKVLPLNLAKPSQAQPGRAWLLPLLRDYTANTNLGHFKTEFLPLSETMYKRVLDHGDAAKTMEIKIYETVVQQIWSILPGYCDLPLDLSTAFNQPFVEVLANLLYQLVDLRLDICRALRCLVESNQVVANSEGQDDLVLQSRVSKDEAKKNLAILASYACGLLAVLFNVYSQTLPQKRGPVLQTINAFLGISTAAELATTFDHVHSMLKPALQEPVQKPAEIKLANSTGNMPSTTNTLMDLVTTMSIYLPRESYGHLFKVASLALLRNDDPPLQKKAYKLIPRLAGSSLGSAALAERSGELQQLFIVSADKATAPARRDRLAAIGAMVPLLPIGSLHFIPAFLPEVVIGCKEHNQRARTAAYEVLVSMARKMTDCTGVSINIGLVPHMSQDAPPATASIEEFFTMVSAGLASPAPHFVSASIMAISRIVYEFHQSVQEEALAELVQTLHLFLTWNNREIVKGVLGFVKVCVISLPTKFMQSHLPTLIPNLMIWSQEHKGHSRAKVKHILERMVRRFGVDMVYKYCPEGDRKSITNIRKTKERNKKRKEAAKHAGADNDEERRNGRRPGKFDIEYDQAFDSSDDSNDSDEAKDESSSRWRRKGGETYIVEDAYEPLDLLSRSALASISSTLPIKTKAKAKSKAKMDPDGKLIFVQDDDVDEHTMDLDTSQADGEAMGVGAFVAALKGKDAPRRDQCGKLRFSNRRRLDDVEEETNKELDEKTATAIKANVGQGGKSYLKRRGGVLGKGKRSGKGRIGAGRRPLGEEKRRGPLMNSRVAKPQGSRGGK